MVYDANYYQSHKEKMTSQMKAWRERNPEYFKNYYTNIIKPKIQQNQKENKQKPKMNFEKDVIEKHSQIKIGPSTYGLNGKKRRQLLALYKNDIRVQKFKENLQKEQSL